MSPQSLVHLSSAISSHSAEDPTFCQPATSLTCVRHQPNRVKISYIHHQQSVSRASVTPLRNPAAKLEAAAVIPHAFTPVRSLHTTSEGRARRITRASMASLLHLVIHVIFFPEAAYISLTETTGFPLQFWLSTGRRRYA